MSGVTVALAGNPNSGKSTVFNALTGSRQRVGNFPGVTVERKEGALLGSDEAVVVDLPGAYSLAPYSAEERIASDFLTNERPDVIIDVVDATNPERNLYLTSQLLELGIPVVVALNMMDEARAAGTKIDFAGLSRALGVPVIPASASAGEGITELAEAALGAARDKKAPEPLKLGGALDEALSLLARLLAGDRARVGLSARRLTAALLEGALSRARTGADESAEKDERRIVKDLENSLGTDACAALAAGRYEAIERICAENIKKGDSSPSRRRTESLDRLATDRLLALPILSLALGIVFYMTFGPVGSFFASAVSRAIDIVSSSLGSLLENAGASTLVRSLLLDGALAGVGGVLAFLPSILILFTLLSLLEDSGYMARVAYIMDRPLRAVGLTGRSIVPMLAGFGCSVPAALATRTLPTERDRKLTALITPFMSCSAKLPVYALVADALLPHSARAIAALYITGILAGLAYCLVFKRTLAGENTPFLIELPAYRFPGAKNVLSSIKRRAGDFIKKAFSVIFLSSIAVWFLRNFDMSLRPVSDATSSALASLGRLIAPIFAPLGFGDWRIATALVSGLSAKEAVVGTLSVLFSRSGATLAEALGGVLTPLSARSLLIFVLLYMPCAAASGALKRELGSSLSAALAMLAQTTLAWLASFAVYQIGSLLT